MFNTEKRAHRRLSAVLLALIGLGLMAGVAQAQSVFATLTGTVTDPSLAVVPNAKVTLKNAASGDVRTTVTNSEGYYTFASVPIALYELSVEAQGFHSIRTKARNTNKGVIILNLLCGYDIMGAYTEDGEPRIMMEIQLNR